MIELEFAVRNVITKADNPDISMSAIDLKGINKRIKNTTKAVYICVSGRVTFCLGEDELSFVTLNAGESICINPNTPYVDFSAEGATMIAINRKAYDQENICELPIQGEILSTIQRIMTTT